MEERNNEQTLANVSSAQAVKIPDEEEIDRCWQAQRLEKKPYRTKSDLNVGREFWKSVQGT